MELHKKNIVLTNKPDLFSSPYEYFSKAREFAYENYSDEIIRIWSTNFSEISEEKFFHEYIWSVHTTGFSAKAVSKFFPRLIEAYKINDLRSLATESDDETLSRVLKVCNNKQKTLAVKKTSQIILKSVDSIGWDEYRNASLNSPESLTKLPYVGKITCFHLARNIGLLDYVKPDLHLIRMCNHWGFINCTEMCQSMSHNEGMPLGIVDLILWYAASTFGTIEIKRPGER